MCTVGGGVAHVDHERHVLVAQHHGADRNVVAGDALHGPSSALDGRADGGDGQSAGTLLRDASTSCRPWVASSREPLATTERRARRSRRRRWRRRRSAAGPDVSQEARAQVVHQLRCPPGGHEPTQAEAEHQADLEVGHRRTSDHADHRPVMSSPTPPGAGVHARRVATRLASGRQSVYGGDPTGTTVSHHRPAMAFGEKWSSTDHAHGVQQRPHCWPTWRVAGSR